MHAGTLSAPTARDPGPPERVAEEPAHGPRAGGPPLGRRPEEPVARIPRVPRLGCLREGAHRPVRAGCVGTVRSLSSFAWRTGRTPASRPASSLRSPQAPPERSPDEQGGPGTRDIWARRHAGSSPASLSAAASGAPGPASVRAWEPYDSRSAWPCLPGRTYAPRPILATCPPSPLTHPIRWNLVVSVSPGLLAAHASTSSRDSPSAPRPISGRGAAMRPIAPSASPISWPTARLPATHAAATSPSPATCATASGPGARLASMSTSMRRHAPVVRLSAWPSMRDASSIGTCRPGSRVAGRHVR